MRSQLERLTRNEESKKYENLIWKEKYQIVDQLLKEEKIYDKYKNLKRSKTPLKKDLRDSLFNPFIEYEKQNFFFEFNLHNFLKFTKLLVFNSEWFIFYMKKKKHKDPTDWSLSDHDFVNDSLRRRIGFFFFLLFVILSSIPIVLCLVYSQIGILNLIPPSQQLTITHFLLIESVVSPLIFSAFLINDNFPIFPNFIFSMIAFAVS